MPTLRQLAAMEKVAESGGKKSVSRAMREVGYSPITAATPKKLTGSKTWENLMEKHLPEKELAKIHNELLHNNYLEEIDFPDTTPNLEIKRRLQGITGASLKGIETLNVPFKGKLKRAYVILPNPKSRKEALELAYKLQGKFAPERVIDETGREQIEQLRKDIKDLIGAK